MDMQLCTKNAFSVIGKEGSTDSGTGFINALWQDATAHFDEIEGLLLRDADGTPVGFWGAMSDFTRSFLPWAEDFSQGLYLAGAEVADDAVAPAGWTKWTIPAYEYMTVKIKSAPAGLFSEALAYLDANGYKLAGAVHDFMNPRENGQPYMYFPIRKI